MADEKPAAEIAKINRLIAEGGPAYPSTMQLTDGGKFVHTGMSLRDYFAAAALSHALPHCRAAFENLPDRPPHAEIQMAALMAYKIADAMLAVRKEGQTNAAT